MVRKQNTRAVTALVSSLLLFFCCLKRCRECCEDGTEIVSSCCSFCQLRKHRNVSFDFVQHVGYCTSLCWICLSLSVPSRSILLLGQKAKGSDGPVQLQSSQPTSRMQAKKQARLLPKSTDNNISIYNDNDKKKKKYKDSLRHCVASKCKSSHEILKQSVPQKLPSAHSDQQSDCKMKTTKLQTTPKCSYENERPSTKDKQSPAFRWETCGISLCAVCSKACIT